ALPVERPNVPAVPGATTEPSDLLTAAVATDAATDAAATQTAAPDPIAAAIAGGETVDPAPLAVAALAPTNTTPAVFDASIVAPTPMPRPSDRSALNASRTPAGAETGSVVGPKAPASLPLVDLVAPETPPTVTTSSGGAAAYVQLSSQRSEGDAKASLRHVQSRWGELFAGNALEIQRADLGQKGIYYRVRLPASSLRDATQICASIKANGGDCFATNG
ncbi:MAG: SPOR domain-containing protein, partial [Devosia sp.]